MKIAIIGAGLAGTSCAYVLKQYGLDCFIVESAKSVAPAASGNDIGLYNPRFLAEYTPEAVFYKTAFETACKTFAGLKAETDWNPCGALHIINDEKKRIRYAKMQESWPWDESLMRLIDKEEASSVAGVELCHDALYLPQSGYVSPRKLCEAYSRNTQIITEKTVTSAKDVEADIIVLACAQAASQWKEAAHLPLKTVRGQITRIGATQQSARLKTALCYGGYATPAIDGQHYIGATFQRWLSHSDIIPQDDTDNIAKFTAAVPALTAKYEVTAHRAALRTATPDYKPVIGRLDDKTYISTAHGSHGILSALMAAHIIAADIAKAPQLLPAQVAKHLDPHRFA